MTLSVYTAITFAPVQGFIEKSRKLRDLYGSSFILSFLGRAICDDARRQLRPDIPLDQLRWPEDPVVSPASINVTQGTPNQIVIRGDFPEASTRQSFLKAWKAIVTICRTEIESRLPESEIAGRYTWRRAWDAWGSHAWECFWAQGEDIGEARERLNETKRSRDWVGINWPGESSTLSGTDAIAWYGMCEAMHPGQSIAQQIDDIRTYYRQLSAALPDSFIDDTEQLSIPELIKRVLMLPDAGFPRRLQTELQRLGLPTVEQPQRFTEVNRFTEDRWTGWFQGDGDRIGHFLKSQGGEDPDILQAFSRAMMTWGNGFQSGFDDAKGRIVYAGGDDFLGVLYRNKPDPILTGQEVLAYFSEFPQVWEGHGQRDAEGKLLTVSVGLVWAAPNVPQRDVLQHCKEAEQIAKRRGRDRLCIRVVFNGGNYLEWLCPWWLLAAENAGDGQRQGLFEQYRDRNNIQGEAANWGHFYSDVTTLEARHSFKGNTQVTLALLEVYFGEDTRTLFENHVWDTPHRSGILGNQEISAKNTYRRVNEWVANLAKVGFRLHRDRPNENTSPSASLAA